MFNSRVNYPTSPQLSPALTSPFGKTPDIIKDPLAQPPLIHPIEAVTLPPADVESLDNGAQLYVLDACPQPVVKLEWLVEASRWHESRESISAVMNALWREGTAELSGADAAERIDFYGATLQPYSSLDYIGFTLYSLEKYIAQVLPIIVDLLLAPVFPQKELEIYVERAVTQLRINADKPDVQAYRLLTEALFGEAHPYGYNSTEAGLRALNVADLHDHQRRHVLGGNTVVFVSGKVSAETRALVRAQLLRMPQGQTPPEVHVLAPLDDRTLHLDLPRSLQSALRLGQIVPGRVHPDFAGLYVLNTILGGYFGSRLMTELREERGLTYNIDSSLDAMRYGAYWYVSAEVAAGKEAEALAAIRAEFELLCTDLVDEDELEMVRSYLMGTYLSLVDGPFHTAEVHRTLVTESSPPGHFERLVDVTSQITAKQVRALARKYLGDNGAWVEVVVGPVAG